MSDIIITAESHLGKSFQRAKVVYNNLLHLALK